MIFPCECKHSWEMIYLLLWLHPTQLFWLNCVICPKDIPIIALLDIWKFPFENFFTNKFYNWISFNILWLFYLVSKTFTIKVYFFLSTFLFTFFFFFSFSFSFSRPLVEFSSFSEDEFPESSYVPLN